MLMSLNLVMVFKKMDIVPSIHQTEGDATAAEGTLKALRPTSRTVPTPPSRVPTVVLTALPTNRAFAGAQVKFTERGFQSTTLFWF